MTVLHRMLMEHIVTNSPKPYRLSRLLALTAPGLMLAACAMNPADAQSATPARVTQVHQICAKTMGLNPANSDFDMCSTSLLQTLAGLDQASLVQRDRSACLQHGLQPGTKEFALCVVDAEAPVAN